MLEERIARLRALADRQRSEAQMLEAKPRKLRRDGSMRAIQTYEKMRVQRLQLAEDIEWALEHIR